MSDTDTNHPTGSDTLNNIKLSNELPNELPDDLDIIEKNDQLTIQGIITTTPNEADQIDAIAAQRGWFQGDSEGATDQTVRAYMSGRIDLEAAVKKLAEPIEIEYSTANHGRALGEGHGEQVGVELDKNKPDNGATAEGLLWDLWYSILHAARRTPWRTQTKLLALTRGLKARPDPLLAAAIKTNETLQRNWIWSPGYVWSDLLMLGPSARECWNDSPSYGPGCSVPEIHAWTNINAFIAGVTKEGLEDFSLYAVWAMRDALEEDYDESDNSPVYVPATSTTTLDAHVPAAVVWVMVMGKELWEKEVDLTPSSPSEGNPARGGEHWKGKAAICKERWRLWKERFQILSQNKTLLSETREIAAEAFAKMEEIERTAAS